MGGVLTIIFARTGPALAFPFLDPTNDSSVPGAAPLGTELPVADVSSLRSQLQLVNPAAAGNPSAWTIIPSLTMQEMFTDNAYEVTSPRLADAITVIAPGISILADTSRLKLNLAYQPNLLVHAINGPLNALTQQLNATGILTVAPDLAYVNITATSGVQSRLGSLSGAGTLGSASAGTASTATAPAATTGEGLTRQNEVQTSSFAISPYLLRQFGDYGSGKLGASVNVSRYASITGFAAAPVPTGGVDGSTLLTTEQIAHYTSGEFLAKTQYSFDADVSQSHTSTDPVTATSATGLTTVPGTSYTSQRQTITNQLSYALTHTFTLLASGGYQNISYSGNQATAIHGLTWSAGITWAPNPDTSVTVTYGHLNGTDALQANGHIAVGGFSLVSFSYTNTVGTQLENLQNQINNATTGAQGNLINAQTGGQALLAANALGVQTGVYRFNTFTASWQTALPRDTLQGSLTWSQQTSLSPSAASVAFDANGNAYIVPATTTGSSTEVAAASISWSHQLSPDLIASSSASYTFTRRSGSGNDGALSTAVGLQYILSQTTTLSARYSFFDRVSKIPGYSLYENILLLGVTKQF